MSKWKKVPKVVQHTRERETHKQLTKTTVEQSFTYHEKQRFENHDEQPTVLAIELHQKMGSHLHWEEKRKWAGLFGTHDPQAVSSNFSKMTLKIEFPNREQAHNFLMALEKAGVDPQSAKIKGELRFAFKFDLTLSQMLLRTLNQMALFTPKMRNAILAWFFIDPNTENAKSFDAKVFGDNLVAASPLESPMPGVTTPAIPVVSLEVTREEAKPEVLPEMPQVSSTEEEKKLEAVAISTSEANDNVVNEASVTPTLIEASKAETSTGVEAVSTESSLKKDMSTTELKAEGSATPQSLSAEEATVNSDVTISTAEKKRSPAASPTFFRDAKEKIDPTTPIEPEITYQHSPSL